MICNVHIGNKPEKEAMPDIVDSIEEKFGRPRQPGATGLYVISNHTGTHASLAFWRDVIKNGAAFANPELFPWTLANSACGYIARHFGITGPNYTFTCPPGNPEPVHEVLKQAAEDRERLCLEDTWVIIID